MKLAISGAQSVGKTTLIKALFDDPEIKDRFILRDETTRNVVRDRLGLGAISINENGGDSTQLLICAQHLINSVVGENNDVIYDRSALDGLVYTTYLFKHGKVSKKTLRIAEAIFENTEYDLNLYIPPEFPIESDGERSTNTDFRNEVVQLFDDYINIYYSKRGIGYLTGTVENRVNQVKELIKAYDDEQHNIDALVNDAIEMIEGKDNV